MTNLVAELRINANAKGLKKEAKASTKDVKALGKSGVAASKDLKKVDKASKSSAKSFSKLGRDGNKLNRNLKSLSKNRADKSLKNTAKAAQKVGANFKNANDKAKSYKKAQEGVAKSAKEATENLKKQADATEELAKVQSKFKSKGSNQSSKTETGKSVPKKNEKKFKDKSKPVKTKGNFAFTGAKKVGGILAGVGLMGVANIVNNKYDEVTEAIARNDQMAGGLASVKMVDPNVVLEKGRELQSKYAGITSYDVADAAYGVKSTFGKMTDQGVAEFSGVAAIAAKATKGDIAEMASNFIAAYSSFKQQFKEMSDAEFANFYGNVISQVVLNNKTDGAQMTGMIKNMGAGLTLGGIPMSEQLAMGGIMQEKYEGSEVGTMFKAYSASMAKAQTNFAKKGYKIKTLDKNNMFLSITKIIDNIKAKFGEEWDAKEQAIIAEAFGGVEAATVLYTLKDKKQGILSQSKIYDSQSKDDIKVLNEMALAHDKDSIAAAQSLNAQSKDLVLQRMGIAKREEIIRKEKQEQRSHLKDAKDLKATGKNTTGTDFGLIVAKDAVKDYTGFAGNWIYNEVSSAFNTLWDTAANPSKHIQIKKNSKTIAGNAKNIEIDKKQLDEKSSWLPSFSVKFDEDLKKITNPIYSSLVGQNYNKKNSNSEPLKQRPKWDANAFYNLPLDFNKWANALKSFKNIGLDTKDKNVNEAARMVGKSAVSEEQLSAWIEKLKSALPADRISLLASSIESLKTGSENPAITNIENNYDQSKDQRQNIKNYHQKNIVTVHVKNGATNAQVGAAVASAIQSKKTAHAAEPMGDKD